MEARRKLARICHKAFMRQYPFDLIEIMKIPCVTAREAQVLGEAKARDLAMLSYHIGYANILGNYKSRQFERSRTRINAIYAGGGYLPGPWGTEAIENTSEAKTIARKKEKEILTSWRKVGSGLYLTTTEIGAMKYYCEIQWGIGTPSVSLHFDDAGVILVPHEIFAIDSEAYLAFDDLTLFREHYENVLRLIDMVRQELSSESVAPQEVIKQVSEEDQQDGMISEDETTKRPPIIPGPNGKLTRAQIMELVRRIQDPIDNDQLIEDIALLHDSGVELEELSDAAFLDENGNVSLERAQEVLNKLIKKGKPSDD